MFYLLHLRMYTSQTRHLLLKERGALHSKLFTERTKPGIFRATLRWLNVSSIIILLGIGTTTCYLVGACTCRRIRLGMVWSLVFLNINMVIDIHILVFNSVLSSCIYMYVCMYVCKCIIVSVCLLYWLDWLSDSFSLFQFLSLPRQE